MSEQPITHSLIGPDGQPVLSKYFVSPDEYWTNKIKEEMKKDVRA
jgi:hypothetical protein